MYKAILYDVKTYISVLSLEGRQIFLVSYLL